jgi:hypothetical protein
MMSALCASGAGAGRRVLFVKGAPESVLERCTGALTNEGSGAVEAMTPGLRSALHAKVRRAAVWHVALQRGCVGAAGRVAALQLAHTSLAADCGSHTQSGPPPMYWVHCSLYSLCPACVPACHPSTLP